MINPCTAAANIQRSCKQTHPERPADYNPTPTPDQHCALSPLPGLFLDRETNRMECDWGTSPHWSPWKPTPHLWHSGLGNFRCLGSAWRPAPQSPFLSPKGINAPKLPGHFLIRNALHWRSLEKLIQESWRTTRSLRVTWGRSSFPQIFP